MGKQKKVGLGQALKANIRNTRHVPSDRHTQAAATKDYATLASCTQENSLDSFLRTADLANVDFTAERLNVKVISHQYSEAIPHPEEVKKRRLAFLKHETDIRIPRRPPWTKEMTKEELDRKEKDSFMTWRKSLSIVQENQHIILTPFEKNLEVWRQLWRVTERSDYIIQIVDARNPIFYWCSDLDRYVKELDASKENILLVNKSDLLSDAQRNAWFAYFKSQDTRVIFYSAIDELEKLEEEEEGYEVEEETELDDEEQQILTNFNKFSLLSLSPPEDDTTPPSPDCPQQVDEVPHPAPGPDTDLPMAQCRDVPVEPCQDTPMTHCEDAPMAPCQESDTALESHQNSMDCEEDASEEENIKEKIGRGEVLKNSEFLTYLTMLREDNQYTVGLVGYPNVGKSSTLNSLLREKRVQVSSTPGKTKHFQTFLLNINNKALTLCDCPGLVYPNLASSHSEMFCNGILPIDHLRDHVGPMSYLIEKIPRVVLESVYGMRLPIPDELEKGRAPYPHEVLREYGSLRGFMTTRGTPDESRGARIMLKDFVNGKLLYVEPPPGHDPHNFNPICQKYMERIVTAAAKLKKTNVTITKENVESNFFRPKEVKMHVKGRTPAECQEAGPGGGKPWKKHNKGKSKEKTRRKTVDLVY